MHPGEIVPALLTRRQWQPDRICCESAAPKPPASPDGDILAAEQKGRTVTVTPDVDGRHRELLELRED